MERILSILLAVLMVGMTFSCLSVSGSAADTKALYATVGDNNTHLLPAGYASLLRRYQSGVQEEVREWSGWAWKNDHANSRLDFFVQQAIPQAELVVSDFTSASGKTISKDNVTATYLGLVNTLTPSYPGIDYDVFDIITHETVKDLEAGQLHEAWVDIYVPENTAAGTYQGTISLKSGNTTHASFTFVLQVMNMTLTDPEDWETYLDL